MRQAVVARSSKVSGLTLALGLMVAAPVYASSLTSVEIAPRFYLSDSAATLQYLEQINRDDARDKLFKELVDASEQLSAGQPADPALVQQLENSLMDFDEVHVHHKQDAARDLQHYLVYLLGGAVHKIEEGLHVTKAEAKFKLVGSGTAAQVHGFGVLLVTGAPVPNFRAQLNLFENGEWIVLEGKDASLTTAFKNLAERVVEHYQFQDYESIMNVKGAMMEAKLDPAHEEANRPSVANVIALCAQMGQGWRLPFADELMSGLLIGPAHQGGLNISLRDRNGSEWAYAVQDLDSTTGSGSICIPSLASTNQTCLVSRTSTADIHLRAFCVKGEIASSINLSQSIWAMVDSLQSERRSEGIDAGKLREDERQLRALFTILILSGDPAAQAQSDASVGHFGCLTDAVAELQRQQVQLPYEQIDLKQQLVCLHKLIPPAYRL